MTKRSTALRVLVATLGLICATGTLDAQWPSYPWKNVPRLADGKIDMAAPARRTADGHPDLSGFWMPVDAVKHLLNLAADLRSEERRVGKECRSRWWRLQ